jgi:predicted nucleic acid-binding Zn ribbon protein
VKLIFAAIGILLAVCVFLIPKRVSSCNFVSQAVKDVNASYDALLHLFESIGNFVQRLGIYTKIPPSTAMTKVVVNIIVELLSILALATKQTKQGPLSESIPADWPLCSIRCREIRDEAFGRERSGGNTPEAR